MPLQTPTWDLTVDVVVAGSGAAGLAAAVTAGASGLRVAVFEKSEAVGGTTAKSGGVYWVPGNHLQRAHGIEDGPERALDYMARVAAPDRFDPLHPTRGLSEWEFDLVSGYPALAAEAIAFFDRIGAIRSTLEKALAFPDYHMDLAEQGGIFGRALCPIDADGLPAKGAELIHQLMHACQSYNVSVATGHPLRSLVAENGQVQGVVVTDAASGTDLRVRALGGVILGTGGFTHDTVLRERYLPTKVWGGCAASGNTGDVVPMLEDLDVPLHAMTNAWWNQVAVEHTTGGCTETPTGMWVAPGDSSLIVDLQGNRVVNEKAFYNDRSMIHFAGTDAPQLLILLYDSRTAELFAGESFAYPLPQPGEATDHVISAASWEALTIALGERLVDLRALTGGLELHPAFASNVSAAVRRFNNAAAAGYDPEFQRGEQPIERYFSGEPRPGGGPNQTMAPLSPSGPYFAILIGLGVLDTKGGPRTDNHGRVLSRDGEPISGLYAAGNCAASPTGDGYWAAGATIGPALAYGYAAARDVAARLAPSGTRSDRHD